MYFHPATYNKNRQSGWWYPISLLDWLAGAVNNNNREFVVVGGGVGGVDLTVRM